MKEKLKKALDSSDLLSILVGLVSAKALIGPLGWELVVFSAIIIGGYCFLYKPRKMFEMQSKQDTLVSKKLMDLEARVSKLNMAQGIKTDARSRRF